MLEKMATISSRIGACPGPKPWVPLNVSCPPKGKAVKNLYKLWAAALLRTSNRRGTSEPCWEPTPPRLKRAIQETSLGLVQQLLMTSAGERLCGNLRCEVWVRTEGIDVAEGNAETSGIVLQLESQKEPAEILS